MPASLPGDWTQRIQKLAQTQPWRWCWEIEAHRSASARTVFRIVGHDAQLTVDGKTFYPMNMTQTGIVRSGEGEIPQVQLSVSSVGNILAPHFETLSGFMGNTATVYLVNLSDLTVFQTFDFTVRGAAVDRQTATLTLELPNFYKRLIPQDRFAPTRCRWIFGGATGGRNKGGCPYVINAFAAYTTCDKTLTECIARGADMAARNLPALLPERFGGFPGIPEQ